MTTCPRCGAAYEPGQEYCLACGDRLPVAGLAEGRTRGQAWQRHAPRSRSSSRSPGGRRGRRERPRILTAPRSLPRPATSPRLWSRRAAPSPFLRPPDEPPGNTADWPAGGRPDDRPSSVPQTKGRPTAVARARQARRKGLSQVGVLDSSQYASLHPGYWVVFSGVYASEAEATSASSPPARSHVRRPCASSRRDDVLCRGDTEVDFVTRRKSRYTLRRAKSRFALPRTSDRGESKRSHGRSRLSTALLYVSILSSDLSLDQRPDRPVRRPFTAARVLPRRARRVRADDGTAGGDPQYFARPDRALFTDIRRYFPITAQAQVAWSVRESRAATGFIEQQIEAGLLGRWCGAVPRDDAQGQGVPADAAARARLLPVSPAPRARDRRGLTPQPPAWSSRAARAADKLAFACRTTPTSSSGSSRSSPSSWPSAGPLTARDAVERRGLQRDVRRGLRPQVLFDRAELTALGVPLLAARRVHRGGAVHTALSTTSSTGSPSRRRRARRAADGAVLPGRQVRLRRAAPPRAPEPSRSAAPASRSRRPRRQSACGSALPTTRPSSPAASRSSSPRSRSSAPCASATGARVARARANDRSTPSHFGSTTGTGTDRA